MHKKIMLLSAILTAAIGLSACDDIKKEPAREDEFIVTTSDVASIPPEAVKETEQSKAASSSEKADSDTESVGTDTNTEKDTDTAAEKADKEEKTEPTDVSVGGLTLSASEIPFDKTVSLSDKNSSAALSGSTLYLLDGRKLHEYSLTDKAEKTDTISLSGEYSRIDTDPYGLVYLSRDNFDCAVLNENGELSQLDTTGELSLSKVVEYGLCKSGNEITKFSDESAGEWSSVTERELNFPDNVSSVEFSGNHVLIARKEDGVSSLAVCDYDGNTLCEASEDLIGDDISAMAEAAGVIAASSCGDLCLWNDSGEYIGRLSSDETAALFGTPSPVMIKRMFAGETGELLAFCTDDKTNEAHLYRITGL